MLTTQTTALRDFASDLSGLLDEALQAQVDALFTAERLDAEGDEAGRDRALLAALTVTRVRKMVEELGRDLRREDDDGGELVAA